MELNEKQQAKLLRLARVADNGELGIVEELDDLEDKIENLPKPEKGEKGDKGDQGERGTDGKDGKDGVDGKDGKDGKDGVDGKDGKDGSPDTPVQVRDKLETLTGDERLDAKAIRGLEDEIEKLRKEISSIPRGTATRSAQSTLFHDMSSQTDGSNMTFTMPKNLAGVIIGSDFPTVLMEGNGFTMNATRTQATLTTVHAPSSGSQLVFLGRSIFNIS